MDPTKQELLRVILQYIQDSRYVELSIFLAIVYLPFVPAFYKEWRNRREVRQLYTARLSDKDQEIERQATRIKELENVLLKTRRK